ncbi:MAG: hypothetical protein JXL97_03120 [Bacteroidales bacterium]|nr:hypothetical protein [Bacteroidales bacterium]
MDWLQIMGYVASAIVATGMTMSSLKTLRWVNLFGAMTFATYGYLIQAYPVGILNSFIFLIDIYYLTMIYTKKEYFKSLPVRADNLYLLNFLDYYKDDIQRFYPDFYYKPEVNKFSFFILRDMAVAGIVLASEYEPEVLKISLDFTIKQYRDFKTGKYIYDVYVDKFKEAGYKILIAFPSSKKHQKYFVKMGFVETNHNGKISYTKNLT